MMQPAAYNEIVCARTQGLHAIQKLAEAHLPLVAMMVRRCPHDDREPEELYQQGCVGLMKAIARYDPDRGTSFSTYAASMILGEMRMLHRLNAPIHIPRPDREKRSRIHQIQDRLTAHLGREPTITEMAAMLRMEPTELVLLMEEVSVSSTEAQTDSGTPLHELLADSDDWLCEVEMRDLIAHLPQRDQALLMLRHQEGLTQSETAKRLGLTQLQVSRREAVIRKRLQKEWYSA